MNIGMLFLKSCYIGFALAFLYSLFSVVRRLKMHKRYLVAIEDILYWIIVFYILFSILHKIYWGIIRWYFIVGIFSGSIFYRMCFENQVVHVMSTIIYKIMWFIRKILQIMLIPIQFISGIIRKWMERSFKRIKSHHKKKLTLKKKLDKIDLCKQ